MKRAPLRFRIKVEKSRFVRVHVHTTYEDMLRAASLCNGERIVDAYAVTVYDAPGQSRGCIADVFYTWNVLRPGVIAHEAGHTADLIALALKVGIAPDSGEFRAQWVERITERVWLKTQSAPL